VAPAAANVRGSVSPSSSPTRAAPAVRRPLRHPCTHKIRFPPFPQLFPLSSLCATTRLLCASLCAAGHPLPASLCATSVRLPFSSTLCITERRPSPPFVLLGNSLSQPPSAGRPSTSSLLPLGPARRRRPAPPIGPRDGERRYVVGGGGAVREGRTTGASPQSRWWRRPRRRGTGEEMGGGQAPRRRRQCRGFAAQERLPRIAPGRHGGGGGAPAAQCKEGAT